MAKVTTLLVVDQGTFFTKTWRWSTQDIETAIITPVDLTGWTSISQIRAASGYLLQDSVPITLGGMAGTITLSFTADMSWAWKWDIGLYDILLINPDGVPGPRFAEGRVDVRRGESRSDG